MGFDANKDQIGLEYETLRGEMSSYLTVNMCSLTGAELPSEMLSLPRVVEYAKSDCQATWAVVTAAQFLHGSTP